MNGERWLVCGSRNLGWHEHQKVKQALARLALGRRPPSAVIEGAATGVDAVAAEWADDASIPLETYPADWMGHGKAAGPIRNRRMLDEGKPTHVIAFPGGRGTADMVRQARKAGVPIIDGLTGEVAP